MPAPTTMLRSRIALNLLFRKTCCDSLLKSSGVRMIRKSFFTATRRYAREGVRREALPGIK